MLSGATTVIEAGLHKLKNSYSAFTDRPKKTQGMESDAGISLLKL